MLAGAAFGQRFFVLFSKEMPYRSFSIVTNGPRFVQE